jgi:hypothetical protein
MKVKLEREGSPLPAFPMRPLLRGAQGAQTVKVRVDASQTKAGKAAVTGYEWFVNGKAAAKGKTVDLALPEGACEVTLKVDDADGRFARAAKSTVVWPYAVGAKLCFTQPVPGGFFNASRKYDDGLGLGFAGKYHNTHTSEPRPQFDMGCRCRSIRGKLQVKVDPGAYELTMGATDWWSTKTGPVAVQGETIEQTVKLDGKKLSWTYRGDVTVKDDGVLTIDLGDARQRALISYVVLTRK